MALAYAALGSMEFAKVAAGFTQTSAESRVLLLAGAALITVGIGFKLAVVPFHMWTPDVYEGAPAPVTAFVATISKGGMFALLIRLFSPVNFQAAPSLFIVFSIIAIASMVIGNLLALSQTNVKRILAYSSIAHLGYLLVAFLSGGKDGISAATFYLVAYFVTTLGAFGVITAFSDRERDADAISDYQGLFWRHPWLAALLAGSMFSLAGIPLTAGFIGKFFLVRAGVGAAQWLLVVVLVLSSVIGLYYYLRVVFALFANGTSHGHEETAPAVSIPPSLSLGGSLILAGLGILLVWLGVYPAVFLQIIQAAAAVFG
jgi:NADH-quinone oxidoreductase subunit N